jgi:hypothetical protein
LVGKINAKSSTLRNFEHCTDSFAASDHGVVIGKLSSRG